MKERLNIEQQQQTVQRLSPRQVQFVRLLEMSAPEIEEEVRRQLDDNPALEATSASEDSEQSSISEIDSTVTSDPDDDPADRHAAVAAGSDFNGVPQIADDDNADLYHHLLEQLAELDLPEETRRIARYIIGNIDENGYLTRSLEAMADDIEIATGIYPDHAVMREAFDAVRSLEPAGVCAVDLRDCLMLQLRRMDPKVAEVPLMIVTDYFDLLSKKHYDRLQAQAGLRDRESLQRALDTIRTLNPKPGSSIAATQSAMRISQITPDVAVERTDDGRFLASLVSSLPQLQIESAFRIDPQAPASSNQKVNARQAQAQAFVRLKRDDAEAFISALRQRSSTLLAVAEAIVKLQPEFFETGQSSKLRPMILKDVGALTGLDLSVISRAAAGKYIATATGTYPMKMFFNEAPRDDSDASSHKLLEVMSEVIAAEDKRHPLSDEAICEAMAAKGYHLARRTVTKYRERLGIPVGRLRKEIT